jgi:lipoprotein NlpI/transglutaminase-like putative cysteine protease
MQRIQWIKAALITLAIGSFSSQAIAQQASQDPAVKEVQIASDAFSRAESLPSWATPLAEIPKESAKGTIQTLLSESQVLAADKVLTLVARAYQINEQSALGEVGQFSISFAPAYEKLKLHKVHVIRGGNVIDKTLSVNVRFLQRETGLESGVYSGRVAAMLLTDDLRVGDTFYLVYSSEGTNPVFGKTFSTSYGWDSGAHTSLRRVTTLFPSERKLDWTVHGDSGGKKLRPEFFEHQGMKAMRFEERDIAGMQFEPNTPSDYNQGRYVQISEYKNWNEVAQWGAALFPKSPKLPSELLDALEKWKSLPSDEAKALAALRWTQNEIRYFSVSIGESSHRPSLPEEVLRRRYGDCKDKTYLLVSLLQAMGIEAHPILVTATAPKAPSRSMPTPEAFDHVVAQVKLGTKLYYMDSTRSGQKGPVDKMGMTLVGASGLVLSEDTKQLTRLEAPHGTTRVSDFSEKFLLDAFGKSGKLAVRHLYRGLAAEYFRVALPRLTPVQKRQVLLQEYERRYPGIILEKDPAFTDNEDANEFLIEAELTIPSLATEQRGDWAIRFYPTNMVGILPLPQQISRTTPALLSNAPTAIQYRAEVTWPDNVGAMLDPATRRVSNDFFTIDVQRSFRGNVSTAVVNYEQRVETVQPKDLPKLLEELKAMDRAIGGVMFVGKEQIKTGGFLGIGKLTLQDNMNKRLDTTIANVGKVIKDNTLSGDDLADAYCERASALADRGKFPEALADAELAVKTAPSNGNAYECRQVVHFYSGKFDAAIQDASKSLSLGGPAGIVINRRALARFYLGQYDQAAADFARAAQIKDGKENEGGLYAKIWQAVAIVRSGKPLPDELKALAQAHAKGDWPRPALALIAGLTTQEQLIAKVNEKKGDDLELTLTEAWFFVGQAHLAKGQLGEARAAFNKVREKQITMYVEHIAAGFELATLK